MKVVKRGKVPRNMFHGTCMNCESELEEHRSKLRVESCPREHQG